jgi:hypothetical protein
MLEVAPGDFRIIYSLDFIGGTGNGDGRPSGFNNRGQLAFHARFTDDSRGIFVSNVVAIPEPNSLLLLALGLVGAYLSQRPTVRTLIPPCSTTGPTQATALAARAKQWSLTPTCRASRLLI